MLQPITDEQHNYVGYDLRARTKIHQSFSYGSFGELLQGELPGINNSFLVTCPIDLSSRTTFYPSNSSAGISVFPQEKVKVKKAVELYLNREKTSLSGIMIINSDISCGKGMASSSADIVSSLRAIADALGKRITPQEIELVLRQIEPSDGVMYEQSVIYNHLNVSLIKKLGSLPKMFILAVDQGGEIDTVSFNDRSKKYSVKEKNEYSLLLSDLEQSIIEQDINKLGSISTTSALLNQARNPKIHFDWVQSLADDISSPGIICAHSGTMLGIILSPRKNEFRNQLAFASSTVQQKGLKSKLISTI